MFHCRVSFLIDEDNALEIVAEDHRTNADETDDQGWDGQQHQRQSDHPGSFMGLLTGGQTMMMIGRNLLVIMITLMFMMFAVSLAEAFLAVEDQEVHTEGVEGSDEDTGQHGKISETGNPGCGTTPPLR